MKELQSILHILNDNTRCVLATLVKVEGSSYRRVGARLLWRPDGLRIGSISGGCLEDDLIERAREVFKTGEPQVIVYDTTSENDLVWGVGLGCHGVVHVLVERISGRPRPWELLAEAWERREPASFGLLFGPHPQTRGLLAASCASGESWQTERVLGPEVSQHASRCFASQQIHYCELATETGQVPVLWEYLPPPVRLLIFGAGNDAEPFSRLAKELGWRVVVVDPRAAYATRERFPLADEVVVLRPEGAVALPSDPFTVAVVMTHHYRFDLPFLRSLLPRNLPYLGLLGPKKRADQILRDLAAEGMSLTDQMRASLHAPVGLDLGGSSPEAVALAILAEIHAILNSRDGRPLRERLQPIHPRSV